MTVNRNIANLPFVFGLAILLFAVVEVPCFGQGTLTITFDGYPPPHSAVYIPYYTGSGMLFEPLPGSDGFGRRNGTGAFGWPDDGSAYLQASAGDSLQFSFLNNSHSDLTAVDLTGYSDIVPDFSVDFVGYKGDGGIVTKNISGSGINFNTYYFDSRFTDLTRVEIPGDGWSLDNVVLTVPEPSAGTLLVLGAIALWAVRRSNCRKLRTQ